MPCHANAPCYRSGVQARKRAEVLEEQTRPAREVVGSKVGSGARAVGKVISKVAEQPAVQAVGRAAMSAVNKTIEAQERLDKKTEELEKKLLESKLAKKVREDVLGEDPRGKGPVEGVAIDQETSDVGESFVVLRTNLAALFRAFTSPAIL
jgi:hypothetical protein